VATGTILIVDDESKILNALAAALRKDGHEVVATTSARASSRSGSSTCWWSTT
jgi:DNA-binding NtrC family response regulator